MNENHSQTDTEIRQRDEADAWQDCKHPLRICGNCAECCTVGSGKKVVNICTLTRHVTAVLMIGCYYWRKIEYHYG